MCGRYVITEKLSAFLETYGPWIHNGPVPANWHVRPTDLVPIIVHPPKADQRALAAARWSLVPRWSESLTLKYPTFNARSETVAYKASFRESVRNRRCILPASGYYEWKTEGKVKTPYYVYSVNSADERLSGDPQPMGFAGLYSWWRDPTVTEPEGGWVLTATILTRDAPAGLAEIHPRIPVMLTAEQSGQWLNPSFEATQDYVDAVATASEQVYPALTYHQVAPLKGDNSARLTDPV